VTPDRLLPRDGAYIDGPVLDVSRTPSFQFGYRSVMWWGVMGMIAIEGTVFALTIFSYLYLWAHAESWPPGVPPPDLLWGTVNTVIMLASALPNHWTKKKAEEFDLHKVRIGLLTCLVFGFAFLIVRIPEFVALNARWDTNAYGSMIWLLLGLHTVHLLTDVFDSIVLTVLFFTGPLEGKRFVDISENSLYWYFVVLAWLPIYFLIYWFPRLAN
jgi:cytochrome c oxidase subunit III